MINSVILQICRKDDFEQLDKIINAHKNEEPEPQQELCRQFPSQNIKRPKNKNSRNKKSKNKSL
jgi:hypothetical protein